MAEIKVPKVTTQQNVAIGTPNFSPKLPDTSGIAKAMKAPGVPLSGTMGCPAYWDIQHDPDEAGKFICRHNLLREPFKGTMAEFKALLRGE